MRTTSLLFLIFFVGFFGGCRTPRASFAVVDSFGSVVVRVEDEAEAVRLSEKMTLMDSVLLSKPQYFVVREDCRTRFSNGPVSSPP